MDESKYELGGKIMKQLEDYIPVKIKDFSQPKPLRDELLGMCLEFAEKILLKTRNYK